jgi:glycine betaine/proline transport system substrate-binding protein
MQSTTAKKALLPTLPKLLFMLSMLAICTNSYADTKQITIGTYPFPEDIAVSHIWKQLLEKKGYSVTVKMASRPIVSAGVAHGSFDLALELWLPYTDKHRYDAIKNKVTLIGPWYKKAWQGLAVPDYVHIQTIAGLKTHAKEFSSREGKLLYTADPGAVVTQHAKKAIRIYHLPFKARVSTESAALAELARAYKNKKPIVLTLWHPHWAWAQYKLHMLKDPKHAFTKANHIYAYSHKGFNKAFPKVVGWLENFHLSPSQLARILNQARKSNSPSDAAHRWITSHKQIWHQWFQAS